MNRVLIIYCGLYRAWTQCSENHKDNIKGNMFWFINKSYTAFYKEVHYENAAGETNQINCLNMWHNRFVAFSMVSPFDAEVFCLNRTDILFDAPIPFGECKDGEIWIPEGNDYREGINDQFCYGTYNAVKDYVSLYLKFEKYHEQGVLFHPETMLLHHLKTLNYEIKRIPVHHKIVRE